MFVFKIKSPSPSPKSRLETCSFIINQQVSISYGLLDRLLPVRLMVSVPTHVLGSGLVLLKRTGVFASELGELASLMCLPQYISLR